MKVELFNPGAQTIIEALGITIERAEELSNLYSAGMKAAKIKVIQDDRDGLRNSDVVQMALGISDDPQEIAFCVSLTLKRVSSEGSIGIEILAELLGK